MLAVLLPPLVWTLAPPGTKLYGEAAKEPALLYLAGSEDGAVAGAAGVDMGGATMLPPPPPPPPAAAATVAAVEAVGLVCLPATVAATVAAGGLVLGRIYLL